jgi:pimeloyl-ACP methyl ester carboxylesterase
VADRIFQLESGRGVSLSAAGDPVARRLVFVCLPMGLAGGFDPDPIVTDRAGVHIVYVDRPGYASSDALEGDEEPRVETFADDLAEYIRRSERMADEVSRVDFGAVGVVGWGFGGQVALSLAARHPDLVDRVAVVSTPAPHRSPLRSPDDFALEARKPGKTVASTSEKLDAQSWQRLDALGIAEDDPALDLPGLVSRLERGIADGARQGAAGVAGDIVAASDHSWASELGSVDASVRFFVGGADPLTDSDDAAWLAKRVPGSEVVTVDGAGRLVAATSWADVLEFVATTD